MYLVSIWMQEYHTKLYSPCMLSTNTSQKDVRSDRSGTARHTLY